MIEQIPMTPKDKLANFGRTWKLILVLLGLVAVVVIGIVSMVVRPDYDTSSWSPRPAKKSMWTRR